MNGRSGLQWQLVVALAALALLGAGCGLVAPKLERYVAPGAGATWTSVRRDTGSYGSGAGQMQSSYKLTTWQGRQVHRYDNPEGSLVANTDDPVAFLAILKGDTPSRRTRPWSSRRENASTNVRSHR